MIIPILKNIADFIDTNTNGYFKHRFHRVERVIQDSEAGLITYPGAWAEGRNEPRPLLNDRDTPYIYLRIAGPVNTERAERQISCDLSYTDTYPVRLVAHVRHTRESVGVSWANVLKQLVAQHDYTIPSGSVIQNTFIEIRQCESDKYKVLEEETKGGNFRPSDMDTIVYVDFDYHITYTPSPTCVDDTELIGECIIANPITQV